MSRSRPQREPHKKFHWAIPLLCATSVLFAADLSPQLKNKAIKQGTLIEPTTGPIVVLANGGLLVARPVGILQHDQKDSKSIRVVLLDSELFGKITLPTDDVAGLLFNPPPGTQARDEAIAKLLLNDRSQTDDRVTLVNGDQLDGPVLEIKNLQVTVETPFGRTDIKTDQITSIVFASKKPIEKTTPRFFTGWSEGSRFPVTKLVTKLLKTKNHRIQIWPYSETLSPWTAQADQLRFVQPLTKEKIVYLSDLTPSDYLHTPFLVDHPLTLGQDRNALGLPLRSNGTLYPKGLGMASRSKLVYTLDEPFSRFEASLAIDDSTDGGGSVIFRILLDGKPVYTSPTLRGGQKPVPISIDVTDAKSLELEVDYADRGDQLDHANWLDARLTKAKKE